MNSIGDFSWCVSAGTSETSTNDKKSGFLQGLGAELAFTQNSSGQYISFYWEKAELYGVKLDQPLDKIGEIFKPIAIAPYLQRVQRVLDSLIPERFIYPFYYQEQYLIFDLVVSPILVTQAKPNQVLVMGRQLTSETGEREFKKEEINNNIILPGYLDVQEKLMNKIVGVIRRTLPPNSELYQKLLTQIARNIRRTLDLENIWEQTVKGFGQALRVSRCLICPYQTVNLENPNNVIMKVVAEYRQDFYSSMLGFELRATAEPYITQALTTQEPVIVENLPINQWNCTSLIAVATCYQNKPNALIIIQECDNNSQAKTNSKKDQKTRQWHDAEIEFIRELAEQVGTAIAHATLYRELEDARQQAEAASRLKSEFLANTSHELRTPLNGMLGFLKLILDGLADDPEEQQEFIEEAHRSALHLLNLINDVLDIAKIEAGKMQIDMAPVKLNELLSDVEDLTRAQIHQKKLNFQIQQPATYDEIILYGNYQRLLQVLLNLVGNAIKFTHEGGITISTEIILKKKKIIFQNQEFPGMVRIRVADTGIGVSLEKQDKLFQSFSQVDGSRTRQYGGTGLGLAISQRLVEAMGGVVNFFSMGEGLGSTVTFTSVLKEEPVMIFNLPSPEANADSN